MLNSKYAGPLLLLLLILPIMVSSQNIGDYMTEMNTSADIDQVYNGHIDSLWNNVVKELVDSVKVIAYSEELFAYYDSGDNEITRDKAELYGYFMLLRQQRNDRIIARFEQNIGSYSQRAIVTIQEIYVKSHLRKTGMDQNAFRVYLTELAERETSTGFQAFYRERMDLQKGERSPDFEIRDLNGNIHSLETLTGKVVVLDFWATWCGPCIKEVPEVKALFDKLKHNDDFVLLSVSRDKTIKVVREFVEKNQIAWPQTVDENNENDARSRMGNMALKFKARALPKYILIDKEGIIRYNSSLNGNMFVPEKLIDRYLSK